MKTKIFPRNQTIPGIRSRNESAATFGNGRSHPPKKSVVAMAETVTMFAYSPRKKNDHLMPEYSVWKPATSSLSASGRSKGTRFVSATPERKYRKNARRPGKTNHRCMRRCASMISTSERERDMRITDTTANPIGTRSEEHTSELQSPCNLVCRL